MDVCFAYLFPFISHTILMMRQNFLRCGMIGWAMEIFWTGLHAFRVRNLKLIGSSSLWMFPIYGSAAFLAPVMQKMRGASLIRRGLVYMSCIFLGEYVSGILLKRRDMCPWDYSRTPWHFRGVIRLDYAPVWFLVGLFYERILLPEAGRSGRGAFASGTACVPGKQPGSL